MRVVAAIPACALIAGAAASLASTEAHSAAAYAALAVASMAAVSAWRLRRTAGFAIAIAAVFAAGGYLRGGDAWQRAWRPPLRIAFEQIAERDEAFVLLEGTLRSDAAPTATGVSLGVDVDACPSCPSRLSRPITGGVLLTVVGALAAERMGQWRAGRRVRVAATVRRPSRYLDPGVPDQERVLARRGTILVGTVKSGALVDVVARGSRIEETLARIRAYARRAIGGAVGRWSPRGAAIVLAIVIGDRSGLDPEAQRALQEAGTYHVIAISGGNVAILAGLLLGAFRYAGWLGRSAMVASIALLAAYAALVGGGASVDRATLMAAVYFAGRACDQRSRPLNTLALTAGLLVAVDPLAVVDPAFVLTFGATLAILAVVPAITGYHEGTKGHLRVSSWLREKAYPPIVSMFAASVAAEAMLFPVGALVFSRITFAGLALNFAAIPLMAVAQIAGMAVVPASLFSTTGAAAIGRVAGGAADGLVWSAGLVRFAPAAVYRVAPPAAAAVVVYYVALLTAWTLRTPTARASGGTRAVRVASTSAAVLAALWIVVDPRALRARRGDGRLHVTFVDVGQGDSAFVRFPRGTALVIDAGGLSFSSTFDVGDRVVAPVIREAGLRRVDYVALTHGDPDHIGGAPSIVREFRPREVWEGIPVPRFEPLTALRLAAQRQGARWANVYTGDHLRIDDVDLDVRHPRPADWERQKVRNDDSIVIELRWRAVSVLFTGDIGRTVEGALAAQLRPSPLRVLKVPHHGSLTSSSAGFVAAVRPQVAVVSVGRANRFGHPAPEVLERYRSIRAEIFRTDEDGAVFVESDGTSVSVHTFTGRQADYREDPTGTQR